MKKHNYTQKTDPFIHQINAIEKISGDHSVALFDEQGLGKTKMIIAGLCKDMEQKMIDIVLVVCKKTLLHTWEKEIIKHSHFKPVIISGNNRERKRQFLTSVRFYVINYEAVISELEILKYLLKYKKTAVVLDESHKIKNPESLITKTIFSLRDLVRKHIIISGTPIANAPEDLWAQFFFLDKGQLFGDDFDAFKSRYSVKIHGGQSKYDQATLAELKHKLINFAIRRTKQEAAPNLPHKRFEKIFIGMSPVQRRMYYELRDKLLLEITDMDGNQVLDEATNILKKMVRLNQIASNPFLIDKSYIETPPKYIQIDSMLKNIVDKGEKAIVWSSYVENIILLKKRYKKYNALTIHGALKISERNKSVTRFQEEDEYKVLIANPSAAKEGLTLTAANNAIYLDRSFNVVDYLQSQDRIHRLSQSKQCNVYILIAKDSIDEYIDDIIYKKSEIARFIQGDVDKIDFQRSRLTKEQLINILGGMRYEK